MCGKELLTHSLTNSKALATTALAVSCDDEMLVFCKPVMTVMMCGTGTAGVGGGEPSTSVSSRADDDDSSRESQPPADNASHKSDSSRDSETTSSMAPVATTTATKVSFTADVIRVKCREMLAKALSAPCINSLYLLFYLLPPSIRICFRRCCLFVCLSVSNFVQKLPNGFT